MPRIMWEATGRRVLTMEWIDGVKLTDRPRMAAKGLRVVDFVDVGIECTLRQLLDKGYFHAGRRLHWPRDVCSSIPHRLSVHSSLHSSRRSAKCSAESCAAPP